MTTNLMLDDVFPFELEFEVATDLLLPILIEVDVTDDIDVPFSFTTCAFGEEGPEWLLEADVTVLTLPSPDPELPVVSDPA